MPGAKTAYLSIGSNLGDRARNLVTAMELLAGPGLRVTRRSSVYETEPQDLRAQPWFLNQVVEVETTLFPRQLLARIHKVESAMGRRRLVDKGPRTIDIDIVLYGSFAMESPDLVIPHPRMADRRFVLEPLMELNPDLRHPGTGESIRQMLGRVGSQSVRRMM